MPLTVISRNAGKGKACARIKAARSSSPPFASGDAGEEQAAKEHEVLETRHDSQAEERTSYEQTA